MNKVEVWGIILVSPDDDVVVEWSLNRQETVDEGDEWVEAGPRFCIDTFEGSNIHKVAKHMDQGRARVRERMANDE